MLTDEALREAEAHNDALWRGFDLLAGTRALTLPELRRKLARARWALVERECDVAAAIMIASCIADIADLEHAQD